MSAPRRVRDGARFVRLCLGIVVTVSAAACAPSPDPSTFTVDYYRTHRQEREAKLAACSNDPGGLGRTADCVNAKAAGAIEGVGSLRDLPPLGLPTKAPEPAQSPKSDNERH